MHTLRIPFRDNVVVFCFWCFGGQGNPFGMRINPRWAEDPSLPDTRSTLIILPYPSFPEAMQPSDDLSSRTAICFSPHSSRFSYAYSHEVASRWKRDVSLRKVVGLRLQRLKPSGCNQLAHNGLSIVMFLPLRRGSAGGRLVCVHRVVNGGSVYCVTSHRSRLRSKLVLSTYGSNTRTR